MTIVLSANVVHSAAAVEEGAPEGFAKMMTGDWSGGRTSLLDRGIDVNLGYVSEVANNTRGGSDEETRYADQWSLGSKIDLQKLVGWNHAALELVITDRNGRNLSDDAQLHTLQSVQEVYGRGQVWRLTRLSYRQSWFDHTVDLKLGRLPVGDDFASFPCDFQNLTFCGSQPGNVRGELWYSAPVSQWGARVKVTLGAGLGLQLGVYQVNPRYIDISYARHQGLYPNNPSGTTGTLIPIEFEWKPKPYGMPGSYKLGAWYDTSSANDVFLDTARQPIALTGGVPLQRDLRDGVYVNLQQQLTGRPKGRGASVFFNVTQSDKDTAASMDRQIALGMKYTGLFDSRPGDTIGFAIGSNHVNSRVADGVRLANLSGGSQRQVPGSERVSELFYSWTPVACISLQPNLQYVSHPGGVSSNESVVIIGLRSSVDF